MIKPLHPDESLLYDDNPQQTEEILRLTLGFLGKHGINPNPVNYTLGYDYVSGRNQELKSALDRALAHGLLDGNLAGELYRRYIWDDDKERFEKLRAELRNLVNETISSVQQASTQAEHSADSMAAHSARLGQSHSADEVRKLIELVVNETRASLYNNLLLRKMLKETRREADALRNELERTRQQVSIDALTGLKNRRAFDAVLHEACAHANGHPASLLLIDIDRFKEINDTYGHLIGDKVIRHVGTLLNANIKGKDTVARLGGEEFAILLTDTPLAAAERVAESLRATIEKGRLTRSDTGETVGHVTVSIGVTGFRRGETSDSFFERADRALYESKHAGRNRVSVLAND